MKLSDLPERHRAEAIRQLARKPKAEGPVHPAITQVMSEAQINAAPELNKTEDEFFQHLTSLHWTHIYTQGITLKIAATCRYTPDFVTAGESGQLYAWEVKGFWRDDARVKIKAAARQYPMITFIAVQKIPKKKGGGWAYEVFRP